MQELSELGIIKWGIEHIAVPLLGGLWGALAWWVNLIAAKFQKLEDKQSADSRALTERIADLDRQSAATYARRDDVKDGFARIDAKLDVLLKHALRESQG